MALGYDVYEEERDYTKEGITGEVTRHRREKLQYPCLIVRSTVEKRLGDIHATTLKNYKISEATETDKETGFIHIYVSLEFKETQEEGELKLEEVSGDEAPLLSFGAIYGRQVKGFLTLFKEFPVYGYLDIDKKLESEYVYILSN